MNSNQLRWILSNEKVTKHAFCGVFALDEVKYLQNTSFPSAYVFNLDPGYKPGLHWVGVYFDKNGVGEYFDSFGRPPTREIRKFLDSYAEQWKYNGVQIQEMYSTTCGQFVIFYLYQRCSGLTLDLIIWKFFTPHGRVMNDMLVCDFVKMHYHFSAKVMDMSFIQLIRKKDIKYIVFTSTLYS